jgi:hypothetical protein
LRAAQQVLDELEIADNEIFRPSFEQCYRHRLELEDRPLPEPLHELDKRIAVDLGMTRKKGARHPSEGFCGDADELEVALQIGLCADRPFLVADGAELAFQFLGQVNCAHFDT